MAFLAWEDKYSVGVKAMDNQHMAMIGMLNELYDAMMSGQALAITGPLLQKLVDYTNTHFSAEEALMQSSRFPGFAEHHVRHEKLVEQVRDYIARFEHDDLFLPIQLMHFLRDWLSTHIQKEDKEYGPWLREHGVA